MSSYSYEQLIEKLKETYQMYYEICLPKNRLNDRDEIFAELVLLDGGVAGLVSSWLGGVKRKMDLSGDIKKLSEKIKKYVPRDEIEKKSQEDFLAYIEKMRELNDLYKLLWDK